MLANVGSVERNYLKFAGQSAGNTVAVKLAHLTRSQVCADDGRLLEIESCVDNVVEARQCKLIDHLGAKVIDDEKIALGVCRGIIGGGCRHTVAETAAFKIRDHANCAVIKNVVTALGHHTRNSGGKVGFAKSRATKEQETFGNRLSCFERKALGIAQKITVVILHYTICIGRGAVVLAGEICKGLFLHQSSKTRGIHACLNQALAHARTHLNAHVTGIAAAGGQNVNLITRTYVKLANGQVYYGKFAVENYADANA